MISDPLSTPLTVTDTVTLGGTLTLDLTKVPVTQDTEVLLINASTVAGAFDDVDFTFAKDTRNCGSQVVSTSNTVSALLCVFLPVMQVF